METTTWARGQVRLPLSRETAAALAAGDLVELTGILYLARDQAHKRLVEALGRGRPLPIDITNQTFYYAGPSPAPPGRVAGSLGPTTAKRMDPFTPPLLRAGLLGMIGKGPRSESVVEAIAAAGAVYFVATGGAAAYLSRFIEKLEVAAYGELGPEALYRAEVKRFPVVVGIDSKGESCLSPLRA